MAALDIILLVAVLAIISTTVRTANEYQRAVVFRLGKYNRTSGPGLYFTIPFLEWRVVTDLRVLTTAVEQQETITRDNVPVKINAVIWRRTINPKASVIEVEDVGDSVVQVAATALRNVIGQHSLDEVLKSQDLIAAALASSIDAVTEPWGVKVERVQMKNVEIPDSMQRAMAQEAEALREKRARLIKAEAEVEAATPAPQCGSDHHGKPCRPGTSADADDHRSRRRAEHHDHHYDAERIRGDGARVHPERPRRSHAALDDRAALRAAIDQRLESAILGFICVRAAWMDIAII